MTAARKVLPKSQRSVAFFCMPEASHFQRLKPLISGLSHSGIVVNVFGHQKFESQVIQAGGVFFDLFSKYPLELADNTSIPVPIRFVSFAGKYARQVFRDVAETSPSLVIHDTFAVIGRLVAENLNLPRVNVCAGHNMDPARFLAMLKVDARVKLSDQCLQAVNVLRDSYGMADASPFSYVSSLSQQLNIYCEPPEFLLEAERKVFEPIAFYGSLPSFDDMPAATPATQRWFGTASTNLLKVYISFGTVIWRSYTSAALSALTCLADTFAKMENVQVVISLGGTKLSDGDIAPLIRPNVCVENYVDQWALLDDVDVFFTHHGMNSTHEAIFHGVPMISYPFFWDQPTLAERCQQFGLAIPLAGSPRGAFSEEDVRTALGRFAQQRESMQKALSRAYQWERAVIENRPEVLRRVVDLIQ